MTNKPYLLIWISSLAAFACGDAATEGAARQTPASVETARKASVGLAANVASGACSSATSGGGWIAGDLGGPRAGTFTIELDATPTTPMDDSLFGLSDGPASHYTDLAGILRFNPAGTIDARNGGSYSADSVVPYNDMTRHFRLDVNVVAHTYSVRTTPDYPSFSSAPIATNFAFRNEQATVSVLDHFALKVDAVGPLGVCNVTVQEPGQCGVAIPGGGFVNRAFASQAGGFTASFTATPAAAGIDGVVGLSAVPAGAFNDIAAAIRFNPGGMIDVRNGGGYTADTFVPYVSKKAYSFQLKVDVVGHSYSVAVNGNSIAQNYAFRTQQSNVSSLANLAIVVDSATGAATACDFAAYPACQSYRDCADGTLCSSDRVCRQECDCPTTCCPMGQACVYGHVYNGPPGEGHGTCL